MSTYLQRVIRCNTCGETMKVSSDINTGREDAVREGRRVNDKNGYDYCVICNNLRCTNGRLHT